MPLNAPIKSTLSWRHFISILFRRSRGLSRAAAPKHFKVLFNCPWSWIIIFNCGTKVLPYGGFQLPPLLCCTSSHVSLTQVGSEFRFDLSLAPLVSPLLNSIASNKDGVGLPPVCPIVLKWLSAWASLFLAVLCVYLGLFHGESCHLLLLKRVWVTFWSNRTKTAS